ncbi:MAG: hypothetical protein JO322_00305 [Candidatus Eremiobacteraeota bacterium]|nr:hypothetical protein [Candidatus Eremiobacteraeota bacterium]
MKTQALLLAAVVTMASTSGTLHETWREFAVNAVLPEQTASGNWLARFSGYGRISVVSDPLFGNALELAPKPAGASSETHAALVTTLDSFEDFDATVQMNTLRQSKSSPGPGDVGWFLWRYSDNQHFYYFSLKPNGWELGKEDPGYKRSQRFLSSGTEPHLVLGTPNVVRVVQRSATIWVYVDGQSVTQFSDLERPYFLGSLGLYCEDSIVRFGSVNVIETTP